MMEFPGDMKIKFGSEVAIEDVKAATERLEKAFAEVNRAIAELAPLLAESFSSLFEKAKEKQGEK